MKEFLIKNNQNLSHQEYIDFPALSSHYIMGFADNGVNIFRDREKRESKAFSFGTAVDTYLLDKELFDNTYIAIPELPTGAGLELYNFVKNKYYPIYHKIPTGEELLGFADELGLWKSTKDKEKRMNLILPLVSHLSIIPQLENKIGISEEEMLNIKTSAAYINVDLNDELFSTDKFRINHYQVVRDIPLFGMCKIEIDQLEVDFEKKVVTITDIKTGEEPAHQFEKAFYKYKYWIQSGFYKHVLADLLTDHMELATFSVKCKYVYISKNQLDKPVVYDLSNNWYHDSMYGWKSTSGYFNKGIYDLVDEIMWHHKTEKYEYPREVYENNCRFIIKTPEEINKFSKILEI